MAVFLQGACLLGFIAVIASLSEAMVCLMGKEPDSNAAHRYRWVIPVEDPCKCTEIRPGGINTRTPGRNFKVIYFDTILISNSPKEIRKWLNCSGLNGELMGRVPASQSVITTHATSDAPATSDIPVTIFTCGRASGGVFPDPYDCSMYYQCDYGAASHKPCELGQHFKVTGVNTGSCTLPGEANCNV